MDFESDIGTPKTPPLQMAGGHVEHPIGLEPLGHVIVTRDGDEPARNITAANALGDGRRTGAGDVAIDDAGEFVEDD
jgi:hypothetical protein